VSKPTTPEDYLASLPVEVAGRLRDLCAMVEACVPGAKLKLSYDMLGYPEAGRLNFGGFQKHLGVYALGAEAAAVPEAAPYLREKGTLQFPHSQPLPVDLIRRLLLAKLAKQE
jgi:uncharacterized protein YdhG (YjbR/CyaY superfamily)